MDDREFSDLRLERKECEKCGALWLNGIHHWRTGNKGNELDLAGLVCNRVKSSQCINPLKNCTGGDTWEKRAEFLGKFEEELKNYDR